MIVITNPTAIENEINFIHSLLNEGLELLHIRKPDFSEEEMKMYLDKIAPEFSNRLVLHQHHDLAGAFGINRIHFSRKERIQISDKPILLTNHNCIKSTSTHSMVSFNALNHNQHFRILSDETPESKQMQNFDYAFLSPVFPSISKPDYMAKNKLLETVKQRNNFSTKLIALGGITHENIMKALENGFDDVAVLGTIWNSSNPIENFKRCQQIALTHSL